QGDPPALEGSFKDALRSDLGDTAKLKVRVELHRLTTQELPKEATLPPSARIVRPSAATLPAGRSVAALSPIVTELASIFAEIALDRAKSGAFEVVSLLAQDVLCTELTWKNNAALKAGLGPGVASLTGPLLPKSCDAVKHLRLQEITASTEALYGA